MNKSIEDIWKEGFSNENLTVPKITAFYNQKSISTVERIIIQFKREVLFLIPLAICLFLFNLWLDNNNAIFWGIISATPCLIWFYLGKKQLKSIVNIDYKTNSYQYLVSVRLKLEKIRLFNKKLAISSIPITLFPMLVYTYFNQQGKTIGEIFGVEGINLPTIAIFLILPVFTLIAALLAELFFQKNQFRKLNELDTLINEMEELRN